MAFIVFPALIQGEPVITNAGNGRSTETKCQEQPAKSFWVRTVDDPVSAFTMVLALLTGGLVLVSGVQIRFLIKADKTSTDAARASQAAAEAAARAADAAIGVEIPRFEMTAATFVNNRTGYSGGDHPGTRFYLEFKNFGRNTAHMIEDCIVVRAGDIPAVCRYPSDNIRKCAIGKTVESDKTWQIESSRDSTATSIPLVSVVKSKPDGVVWVYGYIAYRDFLGQHWRSKFSVAGHRGDDGKLRFTERALNPTYVGRKQYTPGEVRADVTPSVEEIFRPHDTPPRITTL